jgi:hypothetical protein
MLLISTGFSYYRKMKAQVIKEEADQ